MQCSVIIPAHNAEAFIAQTIDSILPQVERLNLSDSSLKNEIIVINDNSSDSTASVVAERYATNPIVKLINRDKNAGEAFIPRLQATEFAESSNVCFIDADDLIEPDYLQKMLKRKDETGADIVLPVMRRFISHRDDSTPYVPDQDFDINKVYNGKELIKETLIRWRISGNGGLYSKRFFLDVAADFKPEPGMIYNDEVFIRYLLANSNKTAFSNAIYYYRINPGSVTQKPTIRKFHILEKNRSLRQFISKTFGKDSIEWNKISIQSFHELIECMRIYNTLDKSCTFRHEAFDYIKSEHEIIIKNDLHKKVSPFLLYIASFDTDKALSILKRYDKLRTLKNFLKK